MANHDGSVVIAFDSDVSDAEKKIAKLKTEIQNLKTEISEKEFKHNAVVEQAQAMEVSIKKAEAEVTKLRQAFLQDPKNEGEYNKSVEKLARMNSDYQKIIESADKLAASIEKDTQELQALRHAGGILQSQVEAEAQAAQKASERTNEMQVALEKAKETVKSLEGQGKWFGDKEYDDAVKKLERINSDIEQYKKELTTPAKPENPFGLDTISGKVREAEIELERLKAAGKGLGDDDYDKAYRNLALMKDEARQYAAELAKTPAQVERETAALEKATQKAQELADKEAAAAEEANRLREIADSAEVSDQNVVNLNKELEELKSRLVDLKSAGVGEGYREFEEISGRISEINNELKEYRANLESVQEEPQKAAGGFDKLLSRVSKLASKVFIFSVITSGLRALRDWMGDVISTNDEASEALARLKGALLTLAQPLVEVIIPAFTTLVNILTRVISLLAGIVSRIFGKTAKQSSDAAKALYDQKKALDGVGSAASSASKSLAGFDEINTLQSGDSGSGGGASVGSDPDFSGVIGEDVSGIEAILGGALLAVGAILAFSGANVPLGIAMMASGALMLVDAIALNWDTIKDALEGPIGAAFGVVSLASLVIGAILAFSGANVPLGIALMALGAIGLATVLALNWDAVKNALEGPIGGAIGITSFVLLVFGAILAFSGANVPLGIGLMALGAVGLSTAVAANWDTVKELLQGPIGAAIGITGFVLLVLGVILLFSGAGIALGIGLILAGAAGLATAIVPNWNTVKDALQGPLGEAIGITGLVLLVLGIILLFTGAGIPLGLGLIAVGAAGLAAAIAPNWDSISQKLKEVWNSIKEWWNTSVAKYFTAEWWSTKGKEMLNGLIESIERGINNALSGVGEFVNKIIGLLNKIPGVDIGWSANWGNVRLPRLAQGAVIPPNREFMAVLGDQKHGTNIEAPLSTIQEAVAIVMEDMIQSNIAGHEATVSVLQAILEAVNAIDTSDERYANAVDAYHQKVAVAKGV